MLDIVPVRYKRLTLIFLASIPLQVNSIQREIVLIKLGGSSITNKGSIEALNPRALDWFASTLVQRKFDHSSFVIVHGAGSFGHFAAKKYGLKGRDGPPSEEVSAVCSSSSDMDDDTTLQRRKKQATKENSDEKTVTVSRAYMLEGLSATRISVQKLNNFVVASLVDHGLPAIGISPCFGIPDVQAHGGKGEENLRRAVYNTLEAGLIPVLHGDACLWGDDGDVGILSGDTVMEILGVASWVSRVAFLTDVDGVYTSDPKQTTDAKLIPVLLVNTDTGLLVNPNIVYAQESGHDHDVTGGLKVNVAVASLLHNILT